MKARFAEAIGEGTKAYTEDRLPAGLPASPNYDMALITMHVLHWCGSAPRRISAVGGRKYLVLLGSTFYSVRVTDDADYRDGIISAFTRRRSVGISMEV